MIELQRRNDRVKQNGHSVAFVSTIFCLLCVCAACGRSGEGVAKNVWSDTAFVRSANGSWDTSVVDLPLKRLTPSRTAAIGKIVFVKESDNLQRIVNAARGGDIIELAPNAKFVGPIRLKRIADDTGWITIRTRDADRMVPIGRRTTPAVAAQFAKVVAPSYATSAIEFEDGAFGFRLTGLELATSNEAGGANSIVEIGPHFGSQDVASEPRLLLLERLWIHGTAKSNFRRCIALNSASTAIVDSWISECHGDGFDSQAIGGWNGTGPYLIANNFLEGAGENIMLGGADPGTKGTLPSDIEIVRNHFYKPPSWVGRWTVKNLFELKVGIRVLIEGNVFENNWTDAQDGFSIVLKSVNQKGSAPWSETRDITFRSNVVRNVANGINAAGSPEANKVVPMSRIVIENNLFERVGNGDFPGGRLMQFSSVNDLTVVRNSGFGVTHGVILYGEPMLRFKLDSNVIGTTQKNYDVWNFAVSSGDGAGYGTSALIRHAVGWSMLNNFMPGVSSDAFPNTWSAPDIAGMNFRGYPNDLHLTLRSPFVGGASGIRPIGVDFDKLERRTSGAVVSGQSSP